MKIWFLKRKERNLKGKIWENKVKNEVGHENEQLQKLNRKKGQSKRKKERKNEWIKRKRSFNRKQISNKKNEKRKTVKITI